MPIAKMLNFEKGVLALASVTKLRVDEEMSNKIICSIRSSNGYNITFYFSCSICGIYAIIYWLFQKNWNTDIKNDSTLQKYNNFI